MNNQEAYNKVKSWLTRKNAERCVDDTGSYCVYFNQETGNRCAIGALLPDDLIKMAIGNEEGVEGLMETHKDIKEYLKDCDKHLLTQLQEIHDNRNNWVETGEFKTYRLNELAEGWGLEK